MGDPKVYDDASLEALLHTAQTRVAALNGFDQGSITGHLGAVQGSTADQTGVAAQVGGLPKQGATASAVTPNAPAQPTLPSFTLPSSFSPSAGDLLNEQTQLNFQMANLQLLLEGSLNDQFLEGSNTPKRRVTLGFPIAISVGRGFQYRQAVAEVKVSVCNPPGTLTSDDPSLVNIIPREKTYNVASIVSKSASVGGGAIAGVVNFGGSLIRGRQTYYLVQDQDTLALPEPPASGICSSGKAVTFVWQFRPVLGQKVVRDGVRQTFAQIAMPPGSTAVACSAKVQIHTSWRRYDVKTGRVGDPIAGTEGDSTSHVPSYDLQPAPTGVVTQDNGDGTVTVIATGGFKTGMRVRIGTQVIDATSPALFEQNAHYIKFIASASSIALMGAFLVNRDGTEAQVIQPRIGATAPSGCQTAVSPISGTGTAQAAPPPPTAVTPAPFTDTTSMVTLPVDPADLPGPVEVAVVVIGTQVFGLMNSPFFSNDGKNVALIVSNDLLRVNNQIKWMKLFSNTPPHTYAIQAASGFAVSGIALLASGVTNSQGSGSGLGSLFAISGSNIKNLKVLIPANTPDGEYNADTIRTIWLSGDQVQNFKSVVVQNPGGAPMVLALPKAAGAGTTPAKPSLDPQPAAGIAATAKTLTITGGGMSQVAAVLSGGTPLAFTAPTDKSLTLTLPALSTPGITVVFIYMDKSLQPYFIPVAGAAH